MKIVKRYIEETGVTWYRVENKTHFSPWSMFSITRALKNWFSGERYEKEEGDENE